MHFNQENGQKTYFGPFSPIFLYIRAGGDVIRCKSLLSLQKFILRSRLMLNNCIIHSNTKKRSNIPSNRSVSKNLADGTFSCGRDIHTLAELVTPSLVSKTFVDMILVPLWEYFTRIESFFPRDIPGLVSDIAKMYCGRDIFLCHCRLSQRGHLKLILKRDNGKSLMQILFQGYLK